MILSNNRSPRRVEQFCRDLGITYVATPKSRRRRAFAGMDQAGTDPAHTAMLGDKLLTDMLGPTSAASRPDGGAGRRGQDPVAEGAACPPGPWKHLAGGVHRI